MGCPQSTSSGGSGRIFFIYLNEIGEMAGFTELPAETDAKTNISLIAYEQFGNSLDGYQDLDKNGLHEILVGAPRRPNKYGDIKGAFYILYPRRRRNHPMPFDWWTFYILCTVPTGIFCCCCCWGIAYFFWYFRRKPDNVEIVIKKSGFAVDPSKPRSKYTKSGKVYVDEYPI